MKKLIKSLILAVLTMSITCVFAQGDAEKSTKDILSAYKAKDTELLKKYLTGFFTMVVTEDFFTNGDGKPLAEIAEKWDGKIREIRYAIGDMMGKEVLLASAYISDNPNGNLNVVLLSSYEGAEWKAFALGLSEATENEFKQGSLEIPDKEKTMEVKVSDHSEFSIEMANGDVFKNPSNDKLKEQLKALDDENFYMILNSKNGFLQASTSDKGYIVQYSNNDGMFEAEEYFTIEMLVDIFVAYIDNENWKDKAKWVSM